MAKSEPAYGLNQPTQNIFPSPVVALRAPTSGDTRYEIGQVWVNKSSGQIYGLASVTSGSATWSILGPGASDVDTLTADSGGALSPSGGNITIAGGTNITTAGAGSTITANLDSAISLTTVTATTVNATTLDTNVAAAGVTLAGTTLAADGTDANISITATPKGSGTFTVDSGGILATAGDIINTHSSSAADVTIEVTNSDNTSISSRAGVEIATGGTSSGDPYLNFLISGGQTFTMGIDNSSTNDDFVISDAAALGTTNRIVIDGSTGDTSVTGNLLLPTAATQLQVEGGAVTDFIGQATLSSGTITVANTNIAAGDRIFCTRSSINGSTALGILTTSIAASTSFTITAVQPGTPASAETNDTSIVDYFIVRSL